MTKAFTFYILLLIFSLTARGEDKVFPMGVWYEGGVGAVRHNLIPDDPAEAAKMYDRDFADLAAHGINLAVVPNTIPPHHKPLLDAAQKHGVKLIIELGYEGDPLGPAIRANKPVDDAVVEKGFAERLTPIKDHPALLRVQLLDEPEPGAFQRYQHIADMLKKFSPRTPEFCCLAGVGGVEKFMDVVKPNVIAFDFYPYGVKTPEADLKPLRAFEAAALRCSKAAEKHNADSWAVIQVHMITNGLRFPTPEEIRCMTHLSLATGNKGVFWFLYQTQFLNVAKKQTMAGLVDENFKGDARWEEIGKLTKVVKKLAPTLAQLSLDEEQPKPEEKASIYLLRDTGNKAYYYAVNLDVQNPQKLTLRGNSKDAVASVTAFPDETVIDSNRDGQDVVWTVELPPGTGALYRID